LHLNLPIGTCISEGISDLKGLVPTQTILLERSRCRSAPASDLESIRLDSVWDQSVWDQPVWDRCL